MSHLTEAQCSEIFWSHVPEVQPSGSEKFPWLTECSCGDTSSWSATREKALALHLVHVTGFEQRAEAAAAALAAHVAHGGDAAKSPVSCYTCNPARAQILSASRFD